VTTSGKTDPAPLKRPTTVNVAFWLAIVSLSIIVLNAVLVLSLKNQSISFTIDAQTELQNKPDYTGQKFTPDQISQAITTRVWLHVGAAVLFSLLGAYFVRKVRDGDRKARIRFTIVGVLLLVALFFTGNYIALAGMLILMIAMAMLFAGSVTRYLNEQ
jgi:hypothetical protein